MSSISKNTVPLYYRSRSVDGVREIFVSSENHTKIQNKSFEYIILNIKVGAVYTNHSTLKG